MSRGDRIRYVPSRGTHSRWGVVVEERADHVLVVARSKFETVALNRVREVKEAR
jgi:hypothetical protein